MLRAVALALALLAATAPPVWAASFYVSPRGDDRAPGTRAAPFRTPARAQQAARRVAPALRQNTVIWLRGGTYRLSAPLVLDARDSGRHGYRVVWRAYPGERPVLSGGRRVGPWRRSGAVWRAPAHGLVTRQLYVNGVRATRARGSMDGLERTDFGYRTPRDRPVRWRNPRDVEFVFSTLWTQQRGLVESVAGDEIRMRQPWYTAARLHPDLAVVQPTWIENAYEFLDQPGEWYLDRARDELYYMPRPSDAIRSVSAVAPVLEQLVVGGGTLAHPLHDVSFEGITFADATWFGVERDGGLAALQANFALSGPYTSLAGTDDSWTEMPAAVSFRAARGITLAADRFVRLGGAGVNFERGCRDSSIVGGRFLDISGSAIQLGDIADHHPADRAAVVQNVLVAGNVIRDVAVEYQGGVGVWAGYVANTSIEHNEFASLPYTAVSIGWGWGTRDDPPTPARGNRVLANSIHDYLLALRDGGGIYVSGAQPGLVVARNVVLGPAPGGAGLYFDDGGRYPTVEGNVVFDSGQFPSFIFKGSDYVIRDNFWDVDTAYGWGALASGTVERNHVISSLEQAPPDVLAAAGPARSATR